MPDAVIAGQRLEYDLTPPRAPGSPTIVFLHEGLGALSTWRDVPARLGSLTGCGTLAYSRWGYGRSDPRPTPWPPTFIHDEARTVLPAFLLACGLTNVVLFGHSDGGSIALAAGALHPACVRGVITEAAHVMVEDETIAGIRDTRARFATGDLRRRLSRIHGDNTDTVFAGWSDAWLAPECRGWNLRPLLPGITCPVLAMQGSQDEYGTPAQLEVIAALTGGPVDTWVIDGCGHTPHRERADAVLGRAASFIGGL